MKPTTQQFNEVIETFLAECDYATPERIAEIQTVIDILTEERDNRAL